MHLFRESLTAGWHYWYCQPVYSVRVRESFRERSARRSAISCKTRAYFRRWRNARECVVPRRRRTCLIEHNVINKPGRAATCPRIKLQFIGHRAHAIQNKYDTPQHWQRALAAHSIVALFIYISKLRSVCLATSTANTSIVLKAKVKAVSRSVLSHFYVNIHIFLKSPNYLLSVQKHNNAELCPSVQLDIQTVYYCLQYLNCD